ncbi:MAG: hypothetical protein KC560_00350, partial [Myxococcales bacterium]|nr:hypothetical protein [Myxococcales bacterium]
MPAGAADATASVTDAAQIAVQSKRTNIAASLPPRPSARQDSRMVPRPSDASRPGRAPLAVRAGLALVVAAA